MDGADPGMRQPGDGAGFAFESLATSWCRVALGREHLDCDETIEPGVAGPVHLTHASRPDRLEDAEGAEQRPWSETRLKLTGPDRAGGCRRTSERGECRRAQELSCTLMSGEQRLDFATQDRVARR